MKCRQIVGGTRPAHGLLMKRFVFLAASLSLALSACSDDTNNNDLLDGSQRPDGSVHPDGTVLLDANLGDGSKPNESPDASLPDAFVPPATPASFKLSLESTRCYGTCPAYSVALHQDGQVDYDGAFCTVKPGALTKQVSAADARTAYDAFVSAGFWSFGSRYRDKTDGCPQVWSDGYTQIWTVAVDGHVKTIERNEGCMGLAALAQLDALAPILRRLTAVDAWVGDGRICPPGSAQLGLSGPYKLSANDQALGILKFDASRYTWTLEGCTGNKLAEGKVEAEPIRKVLRTTNQTQIALPAPVGAVGSIILQTDGGSGLTAKGERVDDEVSLTVTSASGC
ncbi:MAG: hypothetical protein JWN48_2953 [Myxococcaceae bacterium]|nr:hypothetical protein [Myxococcaceae bacterium]